MAVVFLPTLFFIIFYPQFLKKLLKLGLYFFILNLLFEMTALDLGQWHFPGNNFIAWINLGPYRFPFEEFVFWIVLFSLATVSYYEFFYDDRG